MPISTYSEGVYWRKISTTMPPELVKMLNEHLRREGRGENRSAFVRRAILREMEHDRRARYG